MAYGRLDTKVWNAAVVGAGGKSLDHYTSDNPFITAYGNASAATTITIEVSNDKITWFVTQVTQVLAGAGDFVINATIATPYVRLSSSGAATITGWISAKGVGAA